MLKTASNTFIAAMDPLRYEAALGRSALFCVVGSGSDETVFRQLCELSPDYLLLDGVLSGTDSLTLLTQMAEHMPAPPRVLYLGPDETWLEMAKQKGADKAALWHVSEEELLRLAETAASLPLSKLAKGWEETRRSISEKYAAYLGIPEGLKGKHYICLAAAMLACAPQLEASYSTLLYPLIADACRTSPRAVEKAVRTAVENTWLHGDLNAIQALFGYSVDAEKGKPTNAEFLSMLAGYVRRELMRRMENQAEDIPEKMGKMP